MILTSSILHRGSYLSDFFLHHRRHVSLQNLPNLSVKSLLTGIDSKIINQESILGTNPCPGSNGGNLQAAQEVTVTIYAGESL